MTLLPPKKLDALTTLRFFAAAMIVLHHSTGHFGITHAVARPFVLDQAVSFFFVLSGFILTYVYPTLDTWPARGRFWLARFARIWPAHLAAFLLLWLLFHKPAYFPSPVSTPWLALANLALVHAWYPAKYLFFSYNPVSWTLSTEMFFYLAFPLLLHRWAKTWWFKLPLTLGLALATVILTQHYAIPDEPTSPWSFCRDGLIYINPVARLFEFTLGMTTALAFRRFYSRLVLRPAAATILELAVITFTILCMAYTTRATLALRTLPFTGPSGIIWAGHGPLVAPIFALLIFTIALSRGHLSRLLSHPLGVLLGEISFTLYLLHLLLLYFIDLHPREFARYPNALIATLYVAITLLLSWLVWAAVERPIRTRILALAPRRDPASLTTELARAYTDPPTRTFWSPLLTPTRRSIFACSLLLTLFLTPVCYAVAFPPKRITRPADVVAIVKATPPDRRNIHFGPSLTLLGHQLLRTPDGLTIKLAFQPTLPHPAVSQDYTLALHLLDDHGTILSMTNTLEESTHFTHPAPWIDTLTIPAEKLPHATTLGLVLFIPNQFQESIDAGPRDFTNHRLLIPLP